MTPPRDRRTRRTRRAYLGALATVGAGGLAGCVDGFGGDDGDAGGDSPDGGGSTPETDGTVSGEGTTRGGGGAAPSIDEVDLPVPESELNRGARKDGIPAITEPAFAADWSGVDSDLWGDGRVIGVVRDGEARAYPLQILDWHEIVNDSFGGPLLVTYCPLCGSGLTAERRVGGEPATFGVSGLLWQSDLVMYDRATDSLWSQILATAIRGERTGDELTLVPSTFTTWDEWRAEYPDTEVLLPPPESGTIVDAAPRDYERDPYQGYEDYERVGIGYNEFDDDRLHPKAEVLGIAVDGAARAYPFDRVQSAGVVQDTVGDLPVVVTTTPAESLVAYVRRVDGAVVEVSEGDAAHLRAAGSRWRRATGEAVDGPHEGTRLEQANDRSPMFWFAWLDFYEETTVYGEA